MFKLTAEEVSLLCPGGQFSNGRFSSLICPHVLGDIRQDIFLHFAHSCFAPPALQGERVMLSLSHPPSPPFALTSFLSSLLYPDVLRWIFTSGLACTLPLLFAALLSISFLFLSFSVFILSLLPLLFFFSSFSFLFPPILCFLSRSVSFALSLFAFYSLSLSHTHFLLHSLFLPSLWFSSFLSLLPYFGL